jgi:hypothetical protein
MIIGGFEVIDPLPELKAPHVIAMLRPWIDVGSVGAMVLSKLESIYGAKELGKLTRPGNFYDFTRYRPTIRNKGSQRELEIPNTTLTFTQRESGEDFVFLHMLEPHMMAEVFTGSVWQVLKKLGIRRYCLIGSMYDLVPHSRPMLVSGGFNSKRQPQNLERAGVRRSNYEGPTTICNLISQEAQKAGIETLTLIVHLPQYTELDEDYSGLLAILKVLNALYAIPISDEDIQKAEIQIKSIDAALQSNRKLKAVVTQLENHYDSRAAAQEKNGMPGLSPEVEQFLKEMEKKFKES